MKKNVCFLVGTARSGTTWLGSLLQSHPDIINDGEVLHPDVQAGLFFEYLAGRVAQQHRLLDPWVQADLFQAYVAKRLETIEVPTLLFDLKLEQLYYSPSLERAILRPENKFIILKRANLFKQVVSEIAMYERAKDCSVNYAVHGPEIPKEVELHLDPAVIINAMRLKAKLMRDAEEKIRACGSPYSHILYEELLGGFRDAFLDGILEFLEAAQVPLASTLVKQNVQSLWKTIKNWHEVYNVIRTSEFAYTLYLPE